MGVFSWCTSDTQKSIPCVSKGYDGAPKTVYLLNPFGEPYKETDYEGYGEFGGRDVYELVVEWNRKFLSPSNLDKPDRSRWDNSEDGNKSFRVVFERYEAMCRGIVEYANGASDEYMREKYGSVFGYGDGADWKRCLGIKIACYNRDHVKLRYPIKIVEVPCDYDEAQISPSCPFQGYFYPDSKCDIQETVDKAFDRLNAAQLKYLDELKSKKLVPIDEQISVAQEQKSEKTLNGIDRGER